VIENHKAAQNTPEIIAVKSANTKAWLNSLTPEDWDRMNAQRLAKHTVEERSEFGKRGWQTRVENGDTEFTDEHRANISLSVQAWRDSQTDTEKSEQSLKIWDSRRKNGTGTPKRDENGVSLEYIKSLETRAKNGTLTSSKDMWDNMSEEDRKDIRRRMSEGKKRAKEAREAAGTYIPRQHSQSQVAQMKHTRTSYWANLSEEEYKAHCDNISKGRKAANKRRRNEKKD